MLKKVKKEDVSHKSTGALKKKAMVCSTEAAVISIAFHVLLVVFAGSWVAMKYVQKNKASLVGENISRPKLERRQLQMPVKVQNLQKKSRRPKITTRMASVSQANFALPDMAGLGGIGAVGFDRSGGGERNLSSMGSAGSLGFGTSGINFFGARSKGEKMVFVLDADKKMMEDSKGGYYTYKYAKDRIYDMIDGMRSATLFNMMVYTYADTAVFRPQLVPATPENKSSLKMWLMNLNSNPDYVGQIADLGGSYIPSRDYEDSVIGDEAASWLRPVQAAMEQKADNVFILGAGWGRHPVSEEHQALIHGIDLNEEEEWRTKRGWPPERVEAYEEERRAKEDQARAEFAEENKRRAKKGIPPKIIANDGWWHYMVDELKYKMPESPPQMIQEYGQWDYDVDQIVEHMDSVYEFNYIPAKLKKPRVHFVKLIAEDASEGGADDSEAGHQNDTKKMVKSFKGKFEFLRGAKTMEDLLKNNPDIAVE